MTTIWLYLTLMFTLLCASFAYGYDSIEIENDRITLHRAGFLVIEDRISAEQALSQLSSTPLEELPKKAYSFGFDNRDYWFYFEVSLSKDESAEPIYIDLKNIVADRVDFYAFSQELLITSSRSGITVEMDQRPVKSLPIRFKLVNSEEKIIYLVKVNSTLPLYTAFTFGTLYEVDQSWTLTHNIFIISSGIFFALGLYNLFLYFSIKDKVYLSYFLYMLFMFMYDLTMTGYVSVYLPSSIVEYHLTVLAILVDITFVFLVYFTIHFLQLERFKTRFKKYLLILLFILWVSTIPFAFSVQWAYIPYLITISILLTLNLYIGIARYLEGYEPALYFTIATGVAGLFSNGMLLMTQGILIPFNAITFNLATIHMDWDLIALSLALAYRIRLLQSSEKIKEHQEKLLSMLTHELKTPLSVINIALSSDAPSDRLKQNANKSVENICGIIDKCAENLKINHNTYVLNPVTIHVATLINQLVNALPKKDEIVIDIDESISIFADELYLSMVIKNLIENALKYKEKDTPVNIFASKNKRFFYFEITNTVTNNAIPITPSILFDQFYRAPNAYKTHGAGLGLFIVKSIIETMEGTISYKLIENNQIRFNLFLPNQK